MNSGSTTASPAHRATRIIRIFVPPAAAGCWRGIRGVCWDVNPARMKTGSLIDMDGVIYRENHLIPGAAEFVDAMLATGTPFLFLTNNSAPTAEDLAVKLKHLGIRELNARHYETSTLNTADLLSETHPSCTAFVIGESGLAAALHEKKIANDAISPNYVVVGEG